MSTKLMTEEEVREIYTLVNNTLRTLRGLKEKLKIYVATAAVISAILHGLRISQVEKLGILEIVKFQLMEGVKKNE